jgi:hypothetical protein
VRSRLAMAVVVCAALPGSYAQAVSLSGGWSGEAAGGDAFLSADTPVTRGLSLASIASYVYYPSGSDGSETVRSPGLGLRLTHAATHGRFLYVLGAGYAVRWHDADPESGKSFDGGVQALVYAELQAPGRIALSAVGTYAAAGASYGGVQIGARRALGTASRLRLGVEMGAQRYGPGRGLQGGAVGERTLAGGRTTIEWRFGFSHRTYPGSSPTRRLYWGLSFSHTPRTE